jgi:hypothetical protein
LELRRRCCETLFHRGDARDAGLRGDAIQFVFPWKPIVRCPDLSGVQNSHTPNPFEPMRLYTNCTSSDDIIFSMERGEYLYGQELSGSVQRVELHSVLSIEHKRVRLPRDFLTTPIAGIHSGLWLSAPDRRRHRG